MQSNRKNYRAGLYMRLSKGLYKTQNGFCPICGKKITVDTEYKVHENETPKGIVKMLVHRECHNKLHSEESVVVPAFD